MYQNMHSTYIRTQSKPRATASLNHFLFSHWTTFLFSFSFSEIAQLHQTESKMWLRFASQLRNETNLQLKVCILCNQRANGHSIIRAFIFPLNGIYHNNNDDTLFVIRYTYCHLLLLIAFASFHISYLGLSGFRTHSSCYVVGVVRYPLIQ